MVKKRGSGYYWRCHVPVDLQGDVGCREIFRSLTTGLPREAKRRAAGLDAGAHGLWQMVRMMQRRLTPDEIKAMVKAWLDRELAQYADPAFAPLWLTTSKNADELGLLLDDLNDQRQRLTAIYRAPAVGYVSPANDDAIAVDFGDTAILQVASLPDVGLGDGGELAACREVAGELLVEQGIGEVDDNSRQYLVRAVAGAMAELTATQLKTARAAFGLPEPAAPAVVAQPAAPVAPSGAPLLSQVMAERLQELRQKAKDGKRAVSTVDAFERHVPFLLRLLGDRPVDQYRRPDFTKVQGLLQAWPSKARLTKLPPDMPVEAIIARTDLGEPLKRQTVHKILLFITAAFNHAEDAGYIVKSPVRAWEAPELKDEEKVPPFTDEQLARMFSSPTYSDPAVKTKRPVKYWLPLLALLTGKRLGELAQLYVADVVCLDGIWCLDINAAGNDKTIKSRKWGKHVVPIHPRLVELGFLDHVEAMKAAGHERLWPELKHDKVRGYTTRLTTLFARYLQSHVTFDAKGQRPTFRSFRSTFISALEAAGVDDDTLTKLLGHRRANVVLAGHYSKLTPAQSAALLRPAIERLDFEALRMLIK